MARPQFDITQSGEARRRSLGLETHGQQPGAFLRGRGHSTRPGGWGLVVDAPLVGGVSCVWYWGWSGCAS